MPAGTDVISWDPCVGETGDDRYTWPEDCGLEAGPSDIYSNPPTISQVLKGSGYNQLLAEIRRRQYSINWNWVSTTPPPYESNETPIRGNATGSVSSIQYWIAIKNAINDIIGFERQTAVTWPTIPEMPWYWPRWYDPISTDFKQWMLTARKALALDHVRVYPVGHSYISYVDDTYPPDTGGDFYHSKTEAPISSWGGNYGGISFGQVTAYQASRGTFKFDVPSLSLVDDGVEFDPAEARLAARYRDVSESYYVDFVAELREATKLIYESGDWSSYGDLLESWTIPASPRPQIKEHTIDLPPAGIKYFFLIGEKERLDTPPGGSNMNESSSTLAGRDFYMKLYTAVPPEE